VVNEPSTAGRRERLRAALVEAAEGAVVREGLPGLKARNLAAEAGCAVGAIYTVFEDLDALVLQVNLRTLVLFEQALAAGGGEAGSSGADDLVRLALTYLGFARAHPHRWDALFQHRMADRGGPPSWYVAEQDRLFRYVEDPLRRLCPNLAAADLRMLARTLFSAIHGVVSLGLSEKLLALPEPVLAQQVETLVRATAAGLAGPGCA
jgi:AcrR family transcriptional regulator